MKIDWEKYKKPLIIDCSKLKDLYKSREENKITTQEIQNHSDVEENCTTWDNKELVDVGINTKTEVTIGDGN